MDAVKPGRYRHFKGEEYVVIGTATHTETHEVFVLYRPVEEPARLWLRPPRMFFERVLHDGELRPRFAYLGGAADAVTGAEAATPTPGTGR